MLYTDLVGQYVRDVSVRKKSFRNERSLLLSHVRRSGLGGRSVKKLRPVDFDRYFRDRERSVSASTVVREMQAVHAVLEWARKVIWLIEINPMSAVQRPRVRDARERRPSVEEWQAIVRAAEGCTNENVVRVIEFARATAMRRSEILKLQWSDVDFEKRVCRVVEGKNGSGRDVPLFDEAMEVLYGAPKLGASVFGMEVQGFKSAWRRLIKRSGVNDFRFHDIRHDAISRCFEKGMQVHEVQLVSGHKDVRMLMRYTHLKASDLVSKYT